jgi:hypothetical protein
MEQITSQTVPHRSTSDEHLRTLVENMNEGFTAIDTAEGAFPKCDV